MPQASSVEFFDPVTLAHRRSVSLGQGIGSLTWVDRHDGAWWGMFANYDGKGGEPGRDHRYTLLVRFDDQWRRTESWALPAAVLERIAPMSISGGGWGPDGRSYLTGHDRQELYAVALLLGGATLDYRGTYGIEAAGQAIDWDESVLGTLHQIDRAGGQIMEMRVPTPHSRRAFQTSSHSSLHREGKTKRVLGKKPLLLASRLAPGKKGGFRAVRSKSRPTENNHTTHSSRPKALDETTVPSPVS